jgi:hypothetical protein
VILDGALGYLCACLFLFYLSQKPEKCRVFPDSRSLNFQATMYTPLGIVANSQTLRAEEYAMLEGNSTFINAEQEVEAPNSDLNKSFRDVSCID